MKGTGEPRSGRVSTGLVFVGASSWVRLLLLGCGGRVVVFQVVAGFSIPKRKGLPGWQSFSTVSMVAGAGLGRKGNRWVRGYVGTEDILGV